jgi:peptidoglycan-associated lipoprotein
MKLKLLSVVSVALLASACATGYDDAAVGDGSTDSLGSASGSGATDTRVSDFGTDLGAAQASLESEVGSKVYFGYDSAQLSSEARAILEKQAGWLKEHGSLNVAIEGHADERGTREYNLALGERRATAVKNYVTALGVDASRVRVVSYGKERPEALGSNEESWAKNRRSVTVVE